MPTYDGNVQEREQEHGRVTRRERGHGRRREHGHVQGKKLNRSKNGV
jgi:hypothetical protein